MPHTLGGGIESLVTRLAERVAVEAPHDPRAKLAAVAAVLRVTERARDGAHNGAHDGVRDGAHDGALNPELLFIKRADVEGDPWSGHIAFPGGRHDDTDESLLETAVRETREEIAVDLLQHASIIGQLDDLAPRSPMLPRIIIRPYVAVVHHAVEIIPSDEVAGHFWVPLATLRDPASSVEHELEHDGVRMRFPGYRVGPHIAWGLTERIVRQLLQQF